MSAGILLGIGACALCAVVFGALVKKSNGEYALMLTTAAAVGILFVVMKSLGPLIEEVTGLAGSGAVQGLCLEVMLKAAGLTVIGQLAGKICKDAGESALAYGVELATKAAIFTVSMPVLARLFEYLGEIIRL